MGGYISVLYKNYNIPVDNENQYADLFTFRRKGFSSLTQVKIQFQTFLKNKINKFNGKKNLFIK